MAGGRPGTAGGHRKGGARKKRQAPASCEFIITLEGANEAFWEGATREGRAATLSELLAGRPVGGVGAGPTLAALRDGSQPAPSISRLWKA